jgi:hypothetical protein
LDRLAVSISGTASVCSLYPYSLLFLIALPLIVLVQLPSLLLLLLK